MMGAGRSVGLALGERRITAAEVRRTRSGVTVESLAELVFPDDVSWDEPASVGRCLALFLAEHRLPRAGVVGLPTRWLMALEHDVPSVDAQSLVGILRLKAEQAFSLGADRMACDCASAPPEGEAGSALLVATTQSRLAAVAEAMQVARFKPKAVTSSLAALALAAPAGGDGLTVLAAPDGVEVVGLRQGRVASIRRVAVPLGGGKATAVATAVRLAIGPLSGKVDLWNDTGLGDDAVREACGDLGIGAGPEPELPAAGMAEAASAAQLSPARTAPAAALATVGLGARPLPFDFLHSRLAVRAVRPYGRWAAWAAFVLVALLVAAGATIADRSATKGEITAMKAQLREMAPSVASAQSVVDSVTLARGWYDRRPPVLDCLAALTRAIPEDGRIWATSLALREDMHGVLSGKATDKQLVLALLDSLQRSGAFADVRLLYVRETRGAAGEDAFAVAFAHAGTE